MDTDNSMQLSDEINKTNRHRADTKDLNQFVSLAATATELKLIDLIIQAIESPSVYVFGELLDVPNVKALQDTEYEPYLKLLNIFAYSNYKEYKKQKINWNLPELSEPMTLKLRYLSVVSLAKCRRHIPYDTLLAELEMDNIRQLEDLLIDIIYANVIKGTMDQQNKYLEVDQTIARDVREEDYNTIFNVLNEWSRTCDNILSDIEQQIQTANTFKEEVLQSRLSLESKILAIKKNIKSFENEEPVITDLHYSRDAGEKTKRRPLKNHKTPNSKSWRKEA